MSDLQFIAQISPESEQSKVRFERLILNFLLAMGYGGSRDKAARNYAKSVPQKTILIDGDRLTDLMVDHNMVVSLAHADELKRVDSGCIEEE